MEKLVITLEELADSVQQTHIAINQTLARMAVPAIPSEQVFRISHPRSDADMTIPLALFQHRLDYTLSRLVLRIPCYIVELPGDSNNEATQLALCTQAPTLWKKLTGAKRSHEIMVYSRPQRAKTYLRRYGLQSLRAFLFNSPTNIIFLLTNQQQTKLLQLQTSAGQASPDQGFWSGVTSRLFGAQSAT